MKSLKWWLVWCACALLYLPARVLAWALRPMHRPGPWQPRARGRGVWLACVALVLLSAGCVSGAAAGTVAKLLATWDVICPAGREVIVAAAAVVRTNTDDAGAADVSPAAATDAAADAAEGGAP